MPSRAPVPGSVTIFQPTLSWRCLAVSASTLRSFGLSTPVGFAAARFLKFLDRLHHALADFAGNGAIVLADPGEVRLDRQPFGLRHRASGVGGSLQRGADRDGRDLLRLGARRGRRRQLGLGGGARGHEYQCCRQHRSHDKSRVH